MTDADSSRRITYVLLVSKFLGVAADVQAVTRKSPLVIVRHGVGVHPNGAQLGYAEHRHAHVPGVGGQGALQHRCRSLEYAAFADVTLLRQRVR